MIYAHNKENVSLHQSHLATGAAQGLEPAGGLRESKKRQSQGLIIDVAASLFRKVGFQATTMVMIAQEANISPKTVFNHFQSKQGLLSCLLERVRIENDYLGSERPNPKYFDERDALPSRLADGLESNKGLGQGIDVIIANRWLFEIAAEQLDLYSARDPRLTTEAYKIVIQTRAQRIKMVQEAGKVTTSVSAEAIVEIFEITRDAIIRGWLLSPQEEVKILYHRMRTAAMLFINGVKPAHFTTAA